MHPESWYAAYSVQKGSPSLPTWHIPRDHKLRKAGSYPNLLQLAIMHKCSSSSCLSASLTYLRVPPVTPSLAWYSSKLTALWFSVKMALRLGPSSPLSI